MKYVVIVMVVLILVRIDMILLGIEKLGEKLKSNSSSPVSGETLPQPEVPITIKDDQSLALARSPRSEFFALLDDFHLNPKREVREQLIGLLKKNPNILGTNLDRVFEGEIMKLTDLIYNKSLELPLLLVDFLELLQGENLEFVRKFFTIMLDDDVEFFLKAYSRTKDTNCMIASLMGHQLPEEEVLNEYIEREQNLKAFLEREKIDPVIAMVGNNCLMVVQLQISKLTNAGASPQTQVPPTSSGSTPLSTPQGSQSP